MKQRNDFMVDLHENCMAELGFELVAPDPAVRHTTNCATEPHLPYKGLG